MQPGTFQMETSVTSELLGALWTRSTAASSERRAGETPLTTNVESSSHGTEGITGFRGNEALSAGPALTAWDTGMATVTNSFYYPPPADWGLWPPWNSRSMKMCPDSSTMRTLSGCSYYAVSSMSPADWLLPSNCMCFCYWAMEIKYR